MKRILSFVLIAAIAGTGCIKKKDLDFKNLTVDNWQPDWALPILNSTLTLKNIVKTTTTVSEDAQGLYSLHYGGDLFYARASDYIFIPNQNFNTPNITLSVPVSLPAFSGSISDSSSNHFTYSDTSGSQLTEISVKTGTVTFNLTSTFRQNITATLVFPTITKNGAPFQLTTNITYPSTTSTAVINLADNIIDLTNNGTTQNYLPYKIRYTLTGTGQPLNLSDGISANIAITDIKYRVMKGYFGHYNIPIPSDTIDVAVFDNTLQANIFVRNPKINLTFKNSFGFDVTASFDNIYGLTNKGERRDMLVPSITVDRPTTVGGTAISKRTLDSTNSSVQTLFNPAPNQVIYGGNVKINPGGTSTTLSFVTDTSSISLSAEAELPAWFHIIKFELQDTVKLVLPEDSSILQKAEFKMLMDNALPLYGGIQLYFADENYNVIDSLVPTTDDIIGQAPVNGDGVVSGRKQAITKFVMERSRYNMMAPKTRFAIIKGNLKTSGTNSIKILSANNLIVKLAFRFTLNVSSTDL